MLIHLKVSWIKNTKGERISVTETRSVTSVISRISDTLFDCYYIIFSPIVAENCFKRPRNVLFIFSVKWLIVIILTITEK